MCNFEEPGIELFGNLSFDLQVSHALSFASVAYTRVLVANDAL